MLFLGSSIGNLDPASAVDFLRSVRSEMRNGDVLLLSCDLVKSENRMLGCRDVQDYRDRSRNRRFRVECGLPGDLIQMSRHRPPH